jgi:hypothetical protein
MVTSPEDSPAPFERYATSIEQLDNGTREQFDFELDGIVSNHAAGRRYLRGVDNLIARETRFLVRSDQYRDDLFSEVTGGCAAQRLIVCGLGLCVLGSPDSTLPEIGDVLNRQERSVYLTESQTPLSDALRNAVLERLISTADDAPEGVTSNRQFDFIIARGIVEAPTSKTMHVDVIKSLASGGSYCFTTRYLAKSRDEAIPDEPSGEVHAFRCVAPDGNVLSHASMKQRFESLGCEFKSYRLWSKTLGLIGQQQWVHVARKRPAV